MKASSFHAIVDALHDAKVRFIVVGGLAVIAHGYLRATRDANLVIELVPDNIERAFEALAGIGYRPVVPVTAQQFADPGTRQRWRDDKHMEVLQFWSDDHPATKLDVFVEHPFDFEHEWNAAKREATGTSATDVRFATVPTLIQMKQAADRPQDRIDIEYPRKIEEDPMTCASDPTTPISIGARSRSKALSARICGHGDGSASTTNSKPRKR